MKLRRRLRQFGEVLAAAIGIGTIPWLPRPILVALARGLGRIASLVPSRDRRIALANLETVYGDALSPAERKRIVRSAFQTFALTILDMFWFSVRTKRRVRRYVRDDGLLEALQVSPCITAPCHFGNWEVMSHACSLVGLSVTSVAMPMKNPVVDRFLNSFRRNVGQEVVAREGALRALTGALRRGGIIALILDQNTLPEEGGTFVNFYGRPVPVAKTAEALAHRYHASVVVPWCMADKKGAYTMWCEETLTADHPLVKEQGMTQAITTVNERVIRRHPGQWLWMYKRWKYVPAGAPAKQYPYYAQTYEEAT